MAIKAYFDCTWTGPTVEVDNQGNVTSQGEVQGKYIFPPYLELWRVIALG
jgi:hypothetical protein